jgi:hypothetical protein
VNGGQNTGQSAAPGAGPARNAGTFVRSDIFGAPAQQAPRDNPSDPGRFTAPQAYDNGSTGQYAQPGYDNSATGQYAQPGYDNTATGQYAQPGYDNGATGQYAQPGYDDGSVGRRAPAGRHDPSDTGQFERPEPTGFRAPAQQQPPQPQSGQGRGAGDGWELPPATGPGDGRTPLFDTLETNWFRGERRQTGAAAAAQQQSPAPQQRPATPTWRSSPNDELVRQAERVRQPAAGGVTTSGLPRRVPRANLVPGTAQQQQHQSGPQVSRAPDDVRGRLTNLRRGIAQGRQAGSGQTGSYPSPTHQQER